MKSFAQFADLEERVRVANSALVALEQAACPVLDIAFPDAGKDANPPSRLELLKMAPERIRAHVREVALINADQALAVVKSHYPRVELDRFGEGYADGSTEDGVAALLEEVRPVSNLLVDNLELGSSVE